MPTSVKTPLLKPEDGAPLLKKVGERSVVLKKAWEEAAAVKQAAEATFNKAAAEERAALEKVVEEKRAALQKAASEEAAVKKAAAKKMAVLKKAAQEAALAAAAARKATLAAEEARKAALAAPAEEEAALAVAAEEAALAAATAAEEAALKKVAVEAALAAGAAEEAALVVAEAALKKATAEAELAVAQREPATTTRMTCPDPWTKRLRAAISPLEPRPPFVAAQEANLTGMRQVLYVLALGAPVSLLTSAVSLTLFVGHWAWVAGISAAVWILASAGLVLNQYGRLDVELFCARHLGRLGVLGAAVLMSFYVYLAYFPTQVWVLVVLVLMTLGGLGTPWLLSCIRGDDIATRGEINRAQLTATEKIV